LKAIAVLRARSVARTCSPADERADQVVAERGKACALGSLCLEGDRPRPCGLEDLQGRGRLGGAPRRRRAALWSSRSRWRRGCSRASRAPAASPGARRASACRHARMGRRTGSPSASSLGPARGRPRRGSAGLVEPRPHRSRSRKDTRARRRRRSGAKPGRAGGGPGTRARGEAPPGRTGGSDASTSFNLWLLQGSSATPGPFMRRPSYAPAGRVSARPNPQRCSPAPRSCDGRRSRVRELPRPSPLANR
jgi:hypothetical protein